MVQDKRVGVFMKVYRNEPEIHRAVKSVLSQTYINWKYYIYVSDKTKEDMCRYAAQDSRIVVRDGDSMKDFAQYSKELAGDGNDYLTAIDADDYYVEDYLEKLVSFAEKNHTDVTAISYEFIDENEKSLGTRSVPGDVVWNIEQTNQILKYAYSLFRTIWGKLYTAEVIKKYDYERLPQSNEYGGYGGDTFFAFNALYEAKRVGMMKAIGYKYMLSNKGGTHRLAEGRFQSDALLFQFVKTFLETKSVYDEQAAKMLFAVYGNAVIDTIKLNFEADLSEEERLNNLSYVLNQDLTRLLLLRNEAKTLAEIDKTDFFQVLFATVFLNEKSVITNENKKTYFQIYKSLCYAKTNILTEEEFLLFAPMKGVIIDFQIGDRNRLCMILLETLVNQEESIMAMILGIIRKANTQVVLNEVLNKFEFVKDNMLLLKKIYEEDYVGTIEAIGELFSNDELPRYPFELLSIWNNLAAFMEKADEYVLSKEIKIELLLGENNRAEAEAEIKELEELGIDDENMKYLKSLL